MKRRKDRKKEVNFTNNGTRLLLNAACVVTSICHRVSSLFAGFSGHYNHPYYETSFLCVPSTWWSKAFSTFLYQ